MHKVLRATSRSVPLIGALTILAEESWPHFTFTSSEIQAVFILYTLGDANIVVTVAHVAYATGIAAYVCPALVQKA